MALSERLKTWRNSGDYIKVGCFEHCVFVKELGDKKAPAEKTLLLLHGFPESSFSYHRIVEGMQKVFGRIILFDMIGYGFSDKPEKDYAYSLIEQADLALLVWKHFGVKGGHLLAHDMGDSVATELASRQVNCLLPAWFDQGFKSYTFTNGSMLLAFAKLRITQKLLLSKYGHLMKKLVSYTLFSQQVKSAQGNGTLSEEDINDLWEANRLKDGHLKTYLTIKYLNDRKQFEKTRWIPALKRVIVPIHLCWGDADAVARVEMAHQLKAEVCKDATLTIMKDVGHFSQLGSPDVWIKSVCAFYNSLG